MPKSVGYFNQNIITNASLVRGELVASLFQGIYLAIYVEAKKETYKMIETTFGIRQTVPVPSLPEVYLFIFWKNLE